MNLIIFIFLRKVLDTESLLLFYSSEMPGLGTGQLTFHNKSMTTEFDGSYKFIFLRGYCGCLAEPI